MQAGGGSHCSETFPGCHLFAYIGDFLEGPEPLLRAGRLSIFTIYYYSTMCMLLRTLHNNITIVTVTLKFCPMCHSEEHINPPPPPPPTSSCMHMNACMQSAIEQESSLQPYAPVLPLSLPPSLPLQSSLPQSKALLSSINLLLLFLPLN